MHCGAFLFSYNLLQTIITEIMVWTVPACCPVPSRTPSAAWSPCFQKHASVKPRSWWPQAWPPERPHWWRAAETAKKQQHIFTCELKQLLNEVVLFILTSLKWKFLNMAMLILLSKPILTSNFWIPSLWIPGEANSKKQTLHIGSSHY